jgi:hypothetical protein
MKPVQGKTSLRSNVPFFGFAWPTSLEVEQYIDEHLKTRINWPGCGPPVSTATSRTIGTKAATLRLDEEARSC